MEHVYLISRNRSIQYFSLKRISKALLALFPILIFSTVFSQSGTMKGVVTDKDTGEAIPFANVVLYVDSIVYGGASSDFDGKYIIEPITPGNYTLQITYLGYETIQISEIHIEKEQLQTRNFGMNSKAIILDEFVVSDFHVGLTSNCWTTGCKGTSSSNCDFGNTNAGQSEDTDGNTSFCCCCCEVSVIRYETEIAPGTTEYAIDKVQLKVYPNPSNGFVYVEASAKTQSNNSRNIEDVFIIDISGKTLQRISFKDKNKIKLNLYGLPTGMYFLKFANVDHWDYVKVILNH